MTLKQNSFTPFNPSDYMQDEITFDTGRALYRYNPRKPIGEGGQAELFIGTNLDTRQQVAIRRIPLDTVKNAKIWFQREKNFIGNLKHPNIVQVLDYHETSDNLGRPIGYIVQEFIQGETLAARIRDWSGTHSRFDEIWDMNAKIDVMIQVLSGLDYLHQWKIIHRDISPSNIMLVGNQVKIIDFGIAKVLDDDTSFSLVKPSDTYSAPEMSFAPADETVDIYSAAIVFYEMCAGIKFVSPSRASNSTLPPPRTFHGVLQPTPEIPKALFAVLKRAASPKKEDRFQSASAFKQALVQVKEKMSSPKTSHQAAPKSSTKTSLTSSSWKTKPIVPIGILLGFALLVLLAVVLLNQCESQGTTTVNTTTQQPETAQQGNQPQQNGNGEKQAANNNSMENDKTASEIAAKKLETPEELNAIGERWFLEKNGKKNDDSAFKYFKLASDSGLAKAQSNLGSLYLVKKNNTLAIKYYQLAANQGFAEAQYLLGVCYYEFGKDSVQAIKYYQLAANQGLANAQNSLGILYQDGRGVKKNCTKAFELYQQAANQGFASAQYNLGLMYKEGCQDILKNLIMAEKYFQQAANQGDSDAQYELGLIKWDSNPEEAMKYFTKAAKQDHPEATFRLGKMYYYGLGLARKDFSQGVELYRKAARLGSRDAADELRDLGIQD